MKLKLDENLPEYLFMEKETSNKVASGIDELLSPKNIAERLGTTTRQSIDQIFILIGEGRIKQSDLFFILAKKYGENTDVLDKFAKNESSLDILRHAITLVNGTGMFGPDSDIEEMILYISYRRRRVYLGDMYVLISELERVLHEKIKAALIKKHGPDETQWWKEGICGKIRQKCAAAREQDEKFDSDAYAYTTLIDLKEILEKNKSTFCERLPQAVVSNNNNIKTFLEELTRLNKIRNQVAHPVREQDPTEDDFMFVRQMHSKLWPGALWR